MVLLSFFMVSSTNLAALTGVDHQSGAQGVGTQLIATLAGGQAWAKPSREPLTLVTAKGDVRLHVEVARSAQEKALGLMFRTALADDNGMLFAYDSDQIITMWMKNTYIPLDMVFIGADGVIVHIAAMTEPFSEEIISSVNPARFVLELAGGAAARIGLKTGDKVRHDLIKQPTN